MGIFTWTVIGLGVGALANWFLPATNMQGMLLTMLVGLIGGIAGGLVGTISASASVAAFSVDSVMFAGGGALLLLLGFQLSKSVLYMQQSAQRNTTGRFGRLEFYMVTMIRNHRCIMTPCTNDPPVRGPARKTQARKSSLPSANHE